MTVLAYIGDLLYTYRGLLILVIIVGLLAARVAYVVRQPEGYGLPKFKREQLAAIKTMRDNGTMTEAEYRQSRTELLEK